MNRRHFFTRLSLAAVGACIAANVPTTWLPAPVYRSAAIGFMNAEWNRYAKGSGPQFGPSEMWVTQPLFDAMLRDLQANLRFMSATEKPSRPLFRSVTVHPVVKGQRWAVYTHGQQGCQYGEL